MEEKLEKLQKIIDENHKTLMRRINKLEEYNEICDMRNKYIYNELRAIELVLSKIL